MTHTSELTPIEQKIQSTSTNRQARWIIPVLGVLAVLDLCTLARNHTEAEDSYQYIINVTTGTNLFLPNHLLYSPINWLFYRLWTALGYSGDAALPMETLSVVASLASLYLVFRIACRVGVVPIMALAAVGWTAFGFGFWVYSLEAETYLAPVPFMLWSILVLIDVRPTHWRHLTANNLTRLVLLGMLSGFAALLHQQYLFILPIVAVSLVLIWRAMPGRTLVSLLTTVGIYLGVALILIGSVYLLVAATVEGHTSLVEAISWARGHASYGMWAPLTAMSPVLMLVGACRVLFGKNFLGSPLASEPMAKIFPDRSMLIERYLAEHSIGTVSFWLIVVATLVGSQRSVGFCSG